MERESNHGNDVSSRAGRPASGVLSFSEELGARRARGQRQVGADPRLCAGSGNGLGVGRRVDQQQTEGTAEVLSRSGPRSSTPSLGEFILELERPAALVAPRLAAGSGDSREQKQVSGQVVRRMPWVSYCRVFSRCRPTKRFLRPSTEMRPFPGGGIISPAKRAIFDAQDLPRSGCRRC